MRHSEEEKRKLVAYYYNGESVANICLRYGIVRSTFYTWLKQYRTTRTEAGYEVFPAEFAKLRTRVVKLEQEIEVLKKVNCTTSASRKVKLNELAELYGQYSVHVLCEALDVPRGTFYNHMRRNKKENTSYQIRRARLSEKSARFLMKVDKFMGQRRYGQFLPNEVK